MSELTEVIEDLKTSFGPMLDSLCRSVFKGITSVHISGTLNFEVDARETLVVTVDDWINPSSCATIKEENPEDSTENWQAIELQLPDTADIFGTPKVPMYILREAQLRDRPSSVNFKAQSIVKQPSKTVQNLLTTNQVRDAKQAQMLVKEHTNQATSQVIFREISHGAASQLQSALNPKPVKTPVKPKAAAKQGLSTSLPLTLSKGSSTQHAVSAKTGQPLPCIQLPGKMAGTQKNASKEGQSTQYFLIQSEDGQIHLKQVIVCSGQQDGTKMTQGESAGTESVERRESSNVTEALGSTLANSVSSAGKNPVEPINEAYRETTGIGMVEPNYIAEKNPQTAIETNTCNDMGLMPSSATETSENVKENEGIVAEINEAANSSQTDANTIASVETVPSLVDNSKTDVPEQEEGSHSEGTVGMETESGAPDLNQSGALSDHSSYVEKSPEKSVVSPRRSSRQATLKAAQTPPARNRGRPRKNSTKIKEEAVKTPTKEEKSGSPAKAKPHECKECGKTFNGLNVLKQHKRIHSGKTFDCKECPVKFLSKSELKKHTMRHSGYKAFMCEKCGKKFSTKYSCHIHAATAHSELKPYKCKTCGKAFARKQYLLGHEIRHNKVKKHSCKVCKKSFFWKSNLNNHMQVHSDEQEFYTCVCCDRKYKQKRSILAAGHCRRCENAKLQAQGTNHLCTVCGRAFVGESYLINHMRIHAAELHKVRGSFECDICERKFSTKSGLKRHRQQHLRSERALEEAGIQVKDTSQMLVFKTYRCGDCDKEFADRRSLEEHANVHSGARPYECPICNVTFQYHNSLKRHSRSHMEVKPYSCDICGKHFTRRETLTGHLRIHTGEKPYKCPLCPKSFILKQGVKQHLRSHRNKARAEQTVLAFFTE